MNTFATNYEPINFGAKILLRGRLGLVGCLVAVLASVVCHAQSPPSPSLPSLDFPAPPVVDTPIQAGGPFDADDAWSDADWSDGWGDLSADEVVDDVSENAGVHFGEAADAQPRQGDAGTPHGQAPNSRAQLQTLPWNPTAPSTDTFRVQDAPEGSRTFLTNLVLDNLPDDFEDTKKWGHTRERWDGLKVRMDGLKLRTKRRRKEVNHGIWKRYKITLIEPEERLLVKITNWQQRGIGTVAFDLNLAARLNLVGRRQKWNNGVRVYSVTAEAIADVRLTIGMQVSTRLDTSKFPPDVILEPLAESATAQLGQFKLQRISRADGPVVRELGDGLEKILRKKLAEKNDKLVEKVNRQFEKKADDLRLSVSDVVKHKWLGIDPPGEK